MIPFLSLFISRTYSSAHTAPVTAVAAGVNNTLIISSSEDASIAITDLASGKLVSNMYRICLPNDS